MSDEETQARLSEIEERIEELRDIVESCRKSMLASRAAIVTGSVVLVANLFAPIVPPNLLLTLLSFSAIIGGIVWLGANKTTREQALASLRVAEAEWQATIDSLEMSTVGE